ncbi:MAG: GNAT family N-acetyltransferase [Candidatus Bathyarchaeia archaeon]
MDLKFRCLLLSDAEWLTENANDPEAAKYALDIFPVTDHEIEEWLKKDLEEKSNKYIVAELNGEPAGFVRLSFRPEFGRDRHVVWLGIAVRKRHWRRGVGTGLMKEAISFAKGSGCCKLMLGTFEGNERAMPLYEKLGFRTEAYEDEEVYIDGSWKKALIMGLELAPCEPKLVDALQLPPNAQNTKPSENPKQRDINVRQVIISDLDELHRLQNCPDSTKSTYRLPPVTKEETKKWLEKLRSEEGKYCYACTRGKELVGYLHFRAYRLPFPCLKFEEILVDIRHEPNETAKSLVSAIKGFKERYGYHRIFAYVPETSKAVTEALEDQGFKKTGAMKDNYFTDGYYVNVAVYSFL